MRLFQLRAMVVPGILLLVILGPFAAELAAQTAELPRHTESVAWTSGSHHGPPLGGGKVPFRPVVQDTIRIAGVPWMQLRFSGANLGRNSFVELTSVADGATQRLDSSQLAQWGNRSAYFNGDGVEIRLFVGAGDQGVSIDVSEVVVGEWGLPTKSLCGVDNRVASSEPRTGRIDPIGCTGFVIVGGQQLSAGHCLARGSINQTLSFNVPPSLPDGTVQFPPPQHQYSIDPSSFNFANLGIGNDWGTFEVFDNSQTGLQPIAAQGSFSVAQDLGPANIRITGFGSDTGTTNQTNQTNAGPNAGSSGTVMKYRTDTTGGNSGSPVIDTATGSAVGVHSHGGCTFSSDYNRGTSFFNSALWNAIGGSSSSSFTAIADSWVWQNDPTASFGTSTALHVRSAATGHGRHTYLKFHVTGLSGPVQSAKLRIHTGGVAFPASRVYWIVDTTWGEHTINWNNAPLGFHLQYPTSALPANSWVELDVSPIVSGNGTYTIGLVAPDVPGLWFHSRESANKPTLIVN